MYDKFIESVEEYVIEVCINKRIIREHKINVKQFRRDKYLIDWSQKRTIGEI